MERSIAEKSKIILTSAGKQTEFIIEEHYGEGGSCVAYRVSFKESDDIVHFGVLKELCPSYLTQSPDFRRESGKIIAPDEFALAFQEDIINFKNTYKTITDYLAKNPSATNYHPTQLGFYEGNNTVYTLASCDFGTVYDKIDDDGLLSMLKLALSTTKAVEMYHKAGFLHLDIKPQNIFILDGVKDLVKLFDYDSLTGIEDIKSRRVRAIPSPGNYYVPELAACNLGRIGICTDIFEIGAMLYSRLFAKNVQANEITGDGKIDFDSSPFLSIISPEAKYELEVLFKHTLAISPASRFKTTDELKLQLEKLIAIVGDEKPYLMNLPKWQPSTRNIGREEELKSIKQRLDSDGYVFIKGMGGIGKSELAKLYAKRYASEYHTVQFCKYTDSLTALTASLTVSGINDFDYKDYSRLVADKNKVLHSCDCHTLLVVDNYNTTYDEFIREFLPASKNGFKVIFTTRCTQDADYYDSKTIELSPLSLPECKKLFKLHSGAVDDDGLEELVNEVDRNTLILVLIASTIKKSGRSVAQMRELLEKQALDEAESKIFHEYDYSADDAIAYNKLLSHLNAIFSISGLSDGEKMLLKNLSLISASGIECDKLLSCGEYGKDGQTVLDAVYKLADESWVNVIDDGVISMHPIVSDLVAWNEDATKSSSYYTLARGLEMLFMPEYPCHFSLALRKLEGAKHLERRYINEDEEMQIAVISQLGSLYDDMYRYKEAKDCYLTVVKRARKNKYYYFIPYAYKHLGDIEKEIGTHSKAVEYYKKSYEAGISDDIQNYSTALSSLTEIAKCKFDDKANDAAYDEYVKALSFAEKHGLNDSIYDIVNEIIKICRDMDWADRLGEYESLLCKYSKSKSLSEEALFWNEFNKIVSSGAWDEALKEFEKRLSKIRLECGENSPHYKSLAGSRWIFYLANRHKEQGLRCLSEELDFVKEVYGTNSLEMARRLAATVTILPMVGEFDYALRAADRALKICKECGEERSYTAFYTILGKAKCYLLMSDSVRASECLDGVSFDAFSGNESLEIVVSVFGTTLCEVGRYEESEKICFDYLKRKNKTDWTVIQAYITLSIAAVQKGELSAAEEYINCAGKYIDKILARKRKNEWLILYHRLLAQIAWKKQEYEKALDEIENAFEVFDDTYHEPMKYLLFSERGSYYEKLKAYEKAEEDYIQSEKMLEEFNMPLTSYVFPYNNRATLYIKCGKYEKAMTYLDKIIEIAPEVLAPRSYHDAVVCANIGWCKHNLGDSEYGAKLLIAALDCLESINAKYSNDYLLISNSLGKIYFAMERYEDVIATYEKMHEVYENGDFDYNLQMRITVYSGRLAGLFGLKRIEEAEKLCAEELEYITDKYGESSLMYVMMCTETGIILKSNGFAECERFYALAFEAAESGKHKKTREFAKLLNAAGIYFSDFEKEYDVALNFFECSKEVFEETGNERDEYYFCACQNIQTMKKLLTGEEDDE